MAATAQAAPTPTRLADLADGRRDVLMIPITKIRVENDFNVRNFNRPEIVHHVEELMESIVTLGVLEPITVRFEDDLAVIINGECRYRATMMGIKAGKLGEDFKIPCIGAPKTYANEADRLVLSYVKNTGVGFSDLELLTLVRRLEGYGMDRREIERKMGLYHGKMGNLEALAAAPVALQKMVEKEEISASHAANLVRTEGPKEATKIAKTALAIAKSESEKGEDVRVTPKLVKAVKDGASTGDEPVRARKLTGKDGANLLMAIRTLRDIIRTAKKSGDDTAETLATVDQRLRETLKEYAETSHD